ncbi:sulfatase [Salinarchaeum chitinilyticum]
MNVFVIDVDSLRPDHLGAYGYEKPTSPRIDEFAADAVRFDRAYAANSPCMPSRAALLSGRHGVSNGIETHGPRSQVLSSPASWTDYDGDIFDAAPAYRTLPELFFDAGEAAVAISSFPRHPSPWFYHLWTDFHHPREPTRGGPGEPGEIENFQTPRGEHVADLAIERLDDLARSGTADRALGDGLFYVQFWDPHAPYLRSDEEVEPFRTGELPPYPTRDQIDEHHEWDRWRSAADPDLAHSLRHSDYDSVEDREALGELLAHYDAEIRSVDAHIGRFLDELRERGLYDDALIVLTADHGEEFGEHGCYREHWSTHDGTQRVPLLVKPPADAGVDAGIRGTASDALVTNVDLAPTIAAFAELEAPGAWQGSSLRPVLDDPGADWRDRIVVDHGLYTAQRAVRTDRWKFVRTYNEGAWELPERALFDMAADPWEQENLVAERPEVAAELEEALAVWVEAHVGEEGDELREVARTGPAGLELYQ